MPPVQPHGFAPRQDRVSCFIIDRQRKLKISATLATTSKKTSKEFPCHRFVTRTMARLLGKPTVRSHPNKRRKIEEGAPKEARLKAIAVTTQLTSHPTTERRSVLRQADNNLRIIVSYSVKKEKT